jgi:iron-sulfur cluster assembly protein
MITFTDAVIAHFEKQLCQKGGVAFVLGTQRSGCSGMSYVLNIVSALPDAERYTPLNLPIPFYLENKSQPYLKGLTLDLKKEGLQSTVVYINPNETGKCGCGISFSVKDGPA